MSSRRQAQRRSRAEQQQPVTLSPWHVLGLGLIALIVTGILAAADRWQERSSFQASVAGAPQKGEPQQGRTVTDVAQAPTQRTIAEPAPPPLRFVAPEIKPATSPPIDFLRDNRPTLATPAQASNTNAVAPQPASAIAAPPTERGTPAADGPTVTASLAPSAPPTPPARASGAAGTQGAVTRGDVKTSAAAPTECLPDQLRAVLSDVATRFGTVTVVSTHQLMTANHSAGSIREKLHHDCKAVDFRVDPDRIDEIKAYLRGRREIVGVESYRNNVIHMDVSGGLVASASPSRSSRRRAADADAEAAQPPSVQAGTSAPSAR